MRATHIRQLFGSMRPHCAGYELKVMAPGDGRNHTYHIQKKSGGEGPSCGMLAMPCSNNPNEWKHYKSTGETREIKSQNAASRITRSNEMDMSEHA